MGLQVLSFVWLDACCGLGLGLVFWGLVGRVPVSFRVPVGLI